MSASESTVAFYTDAIYVRQDLQGTIRWTEVVGKKVIVILKTSKATVFEITIQELEHPPYAVSRWQDVIQVCSVVISNRPYQDL